MALIPILEGLFKVGDCKGVKVLACEEGVGYYNPIYASQRVWLTFAGWLYKSSTLGRSQLILPASVISPNLAVSSKVPNKYLTPLCSHAVETWSCAYQSVLCHLRSFIRSSVIINTACYDRWVCDLLFWSLWLLALIIILGGYHSL